MLEVETYSVINSTKNKKWLPANSERQDQHLTFDFYLDIWDIDQKTGLEFESLKKNQAVEATISCWVVFAQERRLFKGFFFSSDKEMLSSFTLGESEKKTMTI